MTAFADWLSIAAILITLCGAGVCLSYTRQCRQAEDRVFYVLAAILQLFTAGIYVAALLADWYIVKAGILTRLAAILYATLLTSWAIAHRRGCK
jgi:bacteriorhodopsin